MFIDINYILFTIGIIISKNIYKLLIWIKIYLNHWLAYQTPEHTLCVRRM